MALMKKGPMTQRDLANYLSVEPAAVSRNLRSLQAKDYIVRKTGSDRREKYVFLTEVAKSEYTKWESIVDSYVENLMADLSEKERNALKIMLANLYSRAAYEDTR